MNLRFCLDSWCFASERQQTLSHASESSFLATLMVLTIRTTLKLFRWNCRLTPFRPKRLLISKILSHATESTFSSSFFAAYHQSDILRLLAWNSHAQSFKVLFWSQRAITLLRVTVFFKLAIFKVIIELSDNFTVTASKYRSSGKHNKVSW